MKIKSLEELKAFCAPYATELGMSLIDVELKNGDNPTITFYIDKVGGVDLDACESFSRAIDAPLDEFDPTFGEPYSLNVSSLGIDRPFKTEQDFQDNLDGEVEVKLKTSIKGKKYYEGVLTYFDDATVRIKVGKDTLTIDKKSIIKINKAIKFD